MTRRLRKTIIRLTVGICVVLVGLASVLTLNFWRFESRQIDIAAAPVLPLNEQRIVERFAGAIALKTVSHSNPARFEVEEFDSFRLYLQQSYPVVHEHLDLLTGLEFGDDRNQSLLFKWQGSDPELDAILLMAHYDVVPVGPDELSGWTHPPFAGYFDDKYIWGRGTLDDKCGVIALMEAVESLIQDGFQPKQTVYISLGHDEEVGGEHGNRSISQWMRSQGVRLEYVLDEGGGIFRDFPGIDRPVALIGVAEKGYLSTRLIVDLEDAGHASVPPRDTAITILANAISRLHANPFPRRLNGGAGLMLDYVGPEMPFPNRLAAANRWLFAPLIKRKLGAIPAGDAALRTTIAPTVIAGGFKDNVLPTHAEVTLNLRILPRETVESVMTYLKDCIDDDRIHIEPPTWSSQPTRMSSTGSNAFVRIHHAVKEVFPDAVVAPFVVVAAADARHYDEDSLSKDVYRFTPWKLTNEDLKRVHGIDERISRQDFLDIVRFYERLLRSQRR